MKEIIRDVIENYDEKNVVENHPDGMFVEFSKNYGCDCGITVCGQYDEDNVVSRGILFPFFRGTASQHRRVLWKDMQTKNLMQVPATICELGDIDLFICRMLREYMLEKAKEIF